jgi:hypothetical protein
MSKKRSKKSGIRPTSRDRLDIPEKRHESGFICWAGVNVYDLSPLQIEAWCFPTRDAAKQAAFLAFGAKIRAFTVRFVSTEGPVVQREPAKQPRTASVTPHCDESDYDEWGDQLEED